MGSHLKKISVRGFKSINALEDFELRDLNVLIGANGAGKTNFVDLFRLLRALADEGLQKFVSQQGGADSLLYLGPKITPVIHIRVEFGMNVYEVDLSPTADAKLMFAAERTQYTGGGNLKEIGSGHLESRLRELKEQPGKLYGKGPSVERYIHEAISSWVVYHFHDTSMLSPIRRDQSSRDFERLRPDASNIAAFLLRLRDKHESTYAIIRDAVRLIAPFFDDFLLRPEDRGGEEKLRLEWRQKGSDFPFQPVHLSDGTLRFMCLATALLQPRPPSTIVIDEPELGLHPFAISLLADLLQSAAKRTQVVVSTQSPTLVDHFEPADIVVVNRVGDGSTFQRIEIEQLTEWMQDYSLGELWQKNVVRGGPNGA